VANVSGKVKLSKQGTSHRKGNKTCRLSVGKCSSACELAPY